MNMPINKCLKCGKTCYGKLCSVCVTMKHSNGGKVCRWRKRREKKRDQAILG